MKALVLEEYGKFSFRDLPTPEPEDFEVLIRIKACSVCGSDIHGMDGSTGRRIPPIVMGHEAAGVIEKIGAKVSGWAIGDRVTFDSTVYCGECSNCKSGRVNLCGNRRVMGVSCDEYKLDGAFAEYIRVPARVLYRLPDSVDFVSASMVEPLSVAYHAATRVLVTPGCTCAVVGAGTIGMLIVKVLKALGAGKVIAVDIHQERLHFAKENGADAAILSNAPDALDTLLMLTPDGEGTDICFDATGIQDTVDLAVKVAKKGSSVVLVGNLAKSIELPLQRIVTCELSLFGSCASAGEYPKCLQLIEHGLDVLPLISRQVPLIEGNDWIQRVYHQEPGLNKIILIP